MNKIGFVGYLGYATDTPIVGGQMAKTQGIYNELCKLYESKDLVVVDTSNWKNEKLKLVVQCMHIAFKCKKIIIMPNRNGIKFILPFFAALKSLFGYQIAYPIVGGWLPRLLQKHHFLIKYIKNIDYLLPETKILSNELKEYYDGSMEVMPIFSTRKALKAEEIENSYAQPYKFCTFSRVTPMKGIDDAIEAISRVNKEGTEAKCKLDILGPIEKGYEEHYAELFEKHKQYVTYKGVLLGDNALETLKEYYMMIFPTRYFDEGFPTAVCECFMAGVPVIGSNWRFNEEIIDEGKTGFLFTPNSIEELSERISYTIDNPTQIIKMKKNCIEYSKCFEPAQVMQKLIFWLKK